MTINNEKNKKWNELNKRDLVLLCLALAVVLIYPFAYKVFIYLQPLKISEVVLQQQNGLCHMCFSIENRSDYFITAQLNPVTGSGSWLSRYRPMSDSSVSQGFAIAMKPKSTNNVCKEFTCINASTHNILARSIKRQKGRTQRYWHYVTLTNLAFLLLSDIIWYITNSRILWMKIRQNLTIG